MSPVIVNIRGTSGSGKTHIARAVMAAYASCEPVYQPDGAADLLGPTRTRRAPVGYLCTPRGPGRQLWVAGPYLVASGGADRLLGTFGWSRDQLIQAVREHHDRGLHVLYEGLRLTTDKHRELLRQNARLAEAGLDVRHLPRAAALATVLEALGC